MSEQFPPTAFSAVLTDPAHPLIVGGQAVNLWAEIYTSIEPALHEHEPFTSKDADVMATEPWRKSSIADPVGRANSLAKSGSLASQSSRSPTNRPAPNFASR